MNNHNILKMLLLSLAMVLVVSPQLIAQEKSKSERKVKDKEHKPKKEKKVYPRPENWSVFATAYYTSRNIKGNIGRKNTLKDGIASDLVATGETLDLDRSNGFMYNFGASYKHWFLGLSYMPSLFQDQGNGFSYVDLTGPNGNGVLTEVSTVTKVHIDMYLANIMYEAVRTKHTTFKVGIGAGGSSVNLHVTPQDTIVKEIRFNHTQPFGYLTINMATEYRLFVFSANMNGIAMTLDGVKIDYLDFQFELGYRAYQGYFNIDIIAGYRMVNFAISGSSEVDGTINSTRDVNVDLTLEGPFMGITLSY
ncbi:MAG: hypothetical protein QM503_13125, partial [Bacteroidota bacterium]